ncbi:MAG TPA: endonuclease Q family protein [Verrucomicrobiae bacterium]|nr:endonuclease Q family protein [Verrucomicrobiae bacterium]
MKVFADLHVHIGRSGDGRAVKITGARNLTVENIVYEAANRKGINMVGIVDAGSPGVQRDLEDLIQRGVLAPLSGGGLAYQDTTLILGIEVETGEKKGMGHFIAYLPDLERVKEFARELGGKVTNMQLSTQRARLTARELWDLAAGFKGIVIPAHVFTPHKSLYGSCCDSLREVFRPDQRIHAIELGLSSDTELAMQIGELKECAFLSNSDAHSLGKIGREYNLLELTTGDFKNLQWALENKHGCRIVANFGLDPKLGKYHRTYCEECLNVTEVPPPVYACCKCGGSKVVMGVLDRITELANPALGERPPYIHQVPLQFLPGVGSKTLDKLLANFGTEMNVLHFVDKEQLAKVTGPIIAGYIVASREGRLEISAGGGGYYGKVVVD